MSTSLLTFIWKYSARSQVILLILTVISFPILYMSLELPKQIINEAIGSTTFPITLYGFPLGQFEYLATLCIAFLLTVIVSGVLKMQTNIYKGVVAERLLRRFRYQLISRMLRLPLPQFRRTSQGALISMITAEAEALCTMMGDAISRPVFAAGQMLTITGFLFVQNVWLGVAAIILIPLQAYIIPRLQRQINLLNKERILVVRSLSDRIGETVTGVESLRTVNGLSYTLADFSNRFGEIFKIRLSIYNLKFLMKFLNNFINQLTPFLFLSIGGYLVIQGELTVGALAAALASHKDLMSPWRELLAYYSQIQDVSLRYRTITEQFTQPGMIDEDLFYSRPEKIPHLAGDISIRDLTILDQYGMPVLNRISADFKKGSFIAIQSDNAFARRAFVQALNRSVLPASGSITIAGHDLASLYQETISSRIGSAGGTPHIFSGSVGQNVQMPLMPAPIGVETLTDAQITEIEESNRVGNSPYSLQDQWLDPELVGAHTPAELREWWLEIINAIGLQDMLMQRGLEAGIDRENYPELTSKILAIRERLRDELRSGDFAKFVHFFDRAHFNPALTVSENILFAIRNDGTSDHQIVDDPVFLSTLRELGLEEDIKQLAMDLMAVLVQTFSNVGAEHPMFLRVATLTSDFFESLVSIYRKQQKMGWHSLSHDETMLVMSLPFRITAEQFEDAFPHELTEKITQARRDYGFQIYHRVREFYAPLDRHTYCPNLSILENILFARVSKYTVGTSKALMKIISQALQEEDIKTDIMLLYADTEAGFNGANFPQIAQEHIDFIRAAIRRPDILILDRIFASEEESKRSEMKQKARRLLPNATIIVLESKFRNPQQYDSCYELRGGQLVPTGYAVETNEKVPDETSAPAAAGLAEKLHVLARTALFADLDRKQLRLLAYGSQWVKYEKGEKIFKTGDRTDGAYTFTKGKAELWLPETDEHKALLITTIEPGRIIGDLAIIMERDREFDMVATTDLTGLRIGKQAFLDVVEHDRDVALNLLKTISGHLLNAREMW